MAYHKWDHAEAVVAQRLLNLGFTHAAIAFELNEEFGRERTRDKVADAFRKGTIARMMDGHPETFEDRSPQMKAIQNEDGSTSIDGNRPYSDEEMAEMFGIDMSQWFVTKRLTNHWAKNYQTKLTWAPNELNIVASHWWEFLAEIRENAPHVSLTSPVLSDGYMWEMCLYDAHIGAKAWGPETGEDYDLYIAIARYEDAFEYLLSEMPENVERLLFVVGQDLLHFDSLINGKGGATFKGTPQDVDSRWQKLFIAVCEMLVRLITDAALMTGWVDIVVQPGNHDTQTTFYIGEYLKAWFANDDRVNIDNTPKPRKYVTHGEVTLGFTHGDREKSKDLYGLMTEESGVTRWREWHRGHLHQEECSEDGTMRIRTISALSGKESWHNEQGYRGLPGARAFLWHREYGLLRQEYYNVPFEQTHTDQLGAVLRG